MSSFIELDKDTLNGAVEPSRSGNGPKQNPTERDIVSGRLNLFFHPTPLQFHQGILTLPNLSSHDQILLFLNDYLFIFSFGFRIGLFT